MSIIKCKMCGGDMELSPDKSFGTCEYCGSTMTLPKIDDEQRAASFNRGNHFRRLGEFDKALAVYERIVQEDENDAEAHWCCALCRFGIEYVKDPASGEYLPTCHRASFDSFLEDVDYKAALTHADTVARRQYELDGEQIAAVQRGILATVQKEAPFDVFICYKESDETGQRTIDSTLAQDIYYQLTDQGRRVFFARITLEDKAGQEYEPYIFAALHSAKVMVVVGTRPEYLNAVWVKNEWSRYLALMRQDRKRLLIPCYRDMDPYDMPEQLSVLQSYDMSKIGFIQDLIHGVAKVLDADKPKPEQVVREQVVVQGEGGSNLTALLKRGNMALEDGEWQKADDFFEQVLNMDAECAEAYLGKALAAQKCATLDMLARKLVDGMPSLTIEETIPEAAARIKAACAKYGILNYLPLGKIQTEFSYKRTYATKSADKAFEYQQRVKKYFEQDRLMSRTAQYARGDFAVKFQGFKDTVIASLKAYVEKTEAQKSADRRRAEENYAAFLDSTERKIAELYEQADQQREADYIAACALMEEEPTLTKLQDAVRAFERLGDYKDSQERIEQYQQKIEEIREKERILLEQRERDRQRKKRKTLIAIASAIVVAVSGYFVTTKAIIPAIRYQSAEKMVAVGNHAEAATIFETLGNYKDAAEKMKMAAKYVEAESLLASDNYDAAIEAFEMLGGYSDAAERVPQTGYSKAENLLASGNYDAAIEAFEVLGDYSDAAERVPQTSYSKAENLLALGKYQDAIIVFETLGDYNDAAEQIEPIKKKLEDIYLKMGLLITKDSNVDVSSTHTVALKSDGTVVATGRNNVGQCDIQNWKNIVAISAGGFHTVGLKSEGTVVAAGDNTYNQCNLQNWKDIVAISAGTYHTVGLKVDGTVVATGNNTYGECDVQNWGDIVAVSAGDGYTIGVKSNGTVVAVGSNRFGECNIQNWTNIVMVSAGYKHTVGLKQDGTVVTTNTNSVDQQSWTDIVAVSAGNGYIMGLKSNGTVVATGRNDYARCDVQDWTDIVAISAGDYHTVGLKSDGTVVATGSGEHNKCDVQDWADIQLPKK